VLKLAEVHVSGVYPNNNPFARFKLREVFTFANLQLSCFVRRVMMQSEKIRLTTTVKGAG
jgi:hypothetical protein